MNLPDSLNNNPNPDALSMEDLQRSTVRSISNFSEIRKIKVKGNKFIQKKVNDISGQEREFRNFAEESVTHSLRMRDHADELIMLVELSEDVNVSDDELIKSLGSLLSDARLHKKEAESLHNRIKKVKISLDGFINEINDYNNKITEKRESLPDTIDKTNQTAKGAFKVAIGSYLVVLAGIGIGLAALVAAPATGASIAVAEVCVMIAEGANAAAAVSSVVAEVLIFTSYILNYQLSGVREEFSQFLREMQKTLEDIQNAITYCEIHWERQTVAIEDIIKKLSRNEGRRLVKINALIILSRAKKTREASDKYSFIVRQALNGLKVTEKTSS